MMVVFLPKEQSKVSMAIFFDTVPIHLMSFLVLLSLFSIGLFLFIFGKTKEDKESKRYLAYDFLVKHLSVYMSYLLKTSSLLMIGFAIPLFFKDVKLALLVIITGSLIFVFVYLPLLNLLHYSVIKAESDTVRYSLESSFIGLLLILISSGIFYWEYFLKLN